MTTARFVVTQKGGPCEVIAVTQPKPGPDEVAVRLKAVALNPWDCRQLFDGALVASWPVGIGCDGAGVVEACGPNVKQWEVGDEVFGLFGHGDAAAAFQEVAIVPQHHLGRKPSDLAYTEAAALPLCFMTACSAIHVGLGIQLPFLYPLTVSERCSLTSVLITGGSSNVGAAAIQILRRVLPTVSIIVTSSPVHHPRLRSLGATTAVDRHSASLVADIRSVTPAGAGVDAILDAVGACASQPDLLETLNPTGARQVAEVFAGATMTDCPAEVKHLVVFGRGLLEVTGGESIFTALEQLLSRGEYRPPTTVECVGVGLDSIAAALAALEQGVSGRKLVVAIP